MQGSVLSLVAFFALTIGGARVALPQTAPATALGPSQLIQFLDQTIGWYRQLALERAIATEADDQTIVYENGQIADQAVRLAFDFARAQAEALTRQEHAASGQTSGAGAPSEAGRGGFDAPTGRVVAFSNSIVFQPGAGLFRQIPGTSFVWHEIALSLPRGVDYAVIKETLLAAVAGVLSDYRAELDRQYQAMGRTILSVSSDALQPRIRLRVTSSAVEVVIRFPVDAHHGAEIDERVSHALVKALEGESGLKAGGSDTPEIQLRTDLSAPDATD